MLVAGDEMSRTQKGNNNTYCQDNELSWINWETMDKELMIFTSKLIKLRKEHAAFSRKSWFKGEVEKKSGVADIAWFLPDGSEMTEDNWNHNFAKSVAVFLNGLGLHSVNAEGNKVVDDSFYIIFNAHDQPLSYQLPPSEYADDWDLLIDSNKNPNEETKGTFKAHETIQVEGRSVVLLQHQLIHNGETKHH
jgi:glycogen operon protein